MMERVDDVAAAFLDALGPMEAMKLEKLVYYAQAWSLASGDGKLFDFRIEAWTQGPVVPYLYRQHRQLWHVHRWPNGDSTALSERAQAIVGWIVDRYGALSGTELSKLTHSESPWLDARGGLPATAPSQEVIPVGTMATYYGRQIASPEDAVRHAMGSAALENVTLPQTFGTLLLQVSTGERSAEAVVAELVATHTASA